MPNSDALCKKLQAEASTDGAGSISTAYQLAAAAKALDPACKIKLNDKLTQVSFYIHSVWKITVWSIAVSSSKYLRFLGK